MKTTIFILVIILIDSAPSPFREIFVTILILWILATFGIITIFGLPHILVIGFIVALVISLLTR